MIYIGMYHSKLVWLLLFGLSHQCIMRLLTGFSLPQRLVACIFNPILLLFLTSLLLTIWSFYLGIELRLDNENQNGSATTSVSVSVTVTTTTYATATPSLVHSSPYYINTTSLASIAQEYVDERIYETNHLAAASYDLQTSQWQNSLDIWNASLADTVSNKLKNYQSLLEYNDTISKFLYEKSLQINETWDLFGETALSTENTVQVFNNLTLDYWFVSTIFSNISQDIQILSDFEYSSKIPTINFTSPNLTLNFSKTFDALITNFTSTMSALLVTEEAAVTTVKRDLNTQTVENSRFRRCQKLSIFCLITYILLVMILCVCEWLVFRLENSIFNLHITRLFEMSDGEGSKIVTVQQKSRQRMKELCYTLTKPIMYQIANTIGDKWKNSDGRWHSLSFFISWISSNGRYLWILLFYEIIHWQITTSLTNIESSSIESSSIERNYRRDTNTQDTTSISSVLSGTYEICTDFTNAVDKATNETLVTHFATSLKQQINKINSQMVKLSENSTVVIPPQWNNLSYSDAYTCENMAVNGNEFGYNISSEIVKSDSSKAISHILSKRNSSNQDFSSPDPAWNKLYRWAVLSTMILVFVHLIMGLVIFCKNLN